MCSYIFLNWTASAKDPVSENRIRAIGRKNITIDPRKNEKESIKNPPTLKFDITNFGFTKNFITVPGSRDKISKGNAK
jgi:hypothetical protein